MIDLTLAALVGLTYRFGISLPFFYILNQYAQYIAVFALNWPDYNNIGGSLIIIVPPKIGQNSYLMSILI